VRKRTRRAGHPRESAEHFAGSWVTALGVARADARLHAGTRVALSCDVDRPPRLDERKPKMKIAKLLFRSAPLAALGLASLAGTADAAPTTQDRCSVSDVAIDGTGAQTRLITTCGGVGFVSLVQPSQSCVTRSLDNIKLFESMLMSAFLAGKKATIVYEPASSSCGSNMIYQVVIKD
jgi:hypothetical protein